MAAINDNVNHDRRPFFPHQKGHFSAVDRYQNLDEISRGSYGVVRRARDKKTGDIVAIKEEFHGMSESTKREISILRSLPRHRSIVEYRDAIVDDCDRVFVVMEYVDNDLHRLMATKPRPFTVNGVKVAVRQILEGVAFLHNHGIMHRDIKPSNILVNNKTAKLKLCDFGLSRHCWSESGAYTPGVVTQCYRAPELLMGANVYSYAIDVWSVGCIMAELVLGHVLFVGRSEIQQLRRIYRIMGARGCLLRSMVAAAAVFREAPSLSALGLDLLERLLACDPSRRIAARDALNHAWFTEF
ncbi:hypothetical protein C2S51_014538 [Perilla frutescens var. frutescens]|nr:hypothetical protein C2S51_014538 [Perilla frutescens var. frutescens]